MMTGEGEAYDDCGSFLRGLACPAAVGRAVQTTLAIQDTSKTGHYGKAIMKTCGRLECPSCWVSAAHRAGDRIEGTLRACQELFDLQDPRHLVISPPEVGPEAWAHRFAAATTEEESADVTRRLVIKGNKLAHRMGLVAWAILPHLHRCEEKDGGGERYRRSEKYWSPHLHLIAFGRAVPFDDFRKLSRGWLYVNLDSKKQKDGTIRRVKRRKIKETVAYVLSHAPLYENKRCYSYGGLASPRSMVIDSETVERIPVICPCSAEVQVYGVIDLPELGPTIDWSMPRGPAFSVKRTRTYRRRDQPRLADVQVRDDVLVDICVRCGCRLELCRAGATACTELVL